MAAKKFNMVGFAMRYLFAFVLVWLTYNPHGWSFYHWIIQDPSPDPFKALAGIVLIAAWGIYMRATFRSLGPIGLVIAAAFFAVLVWLGFDLGLLDMRNGIVVTYVVIFVLVGILATGMSWSHIRRRLSGQVDTDDVSEE